MKLRTLSDLFLDQIGDLHSAEKQLVRALPKMAKAAKNKELRHAFDHHLEQTKGHVERLETILESLDHSPGRKKCKAMEGLVAEGEEFLSEDAMDEVRDAGLIAIAQRVEHYEIAGYGTAATFARQLGYTLPEELLRQTLAEEVETDKKLTDLAESSINLKAELSV